MGKATTREINQSVTDSADQRSNTQTGDRNGRKTLGHTSDSANSRLPMYCRATADPRDKFWCVLGKQVRHGAAVRITVRG